MPKYEVHIPAPEAGGFNMTLKVNADNWMAALKAGMQKLGEQGAVSSNVMVDVQEDQSIHITDNMSGRVFRIRELSDEEAAKAQVKRPSQIRPAAQVRAEAKTDPGRPAAPPSRSEKTEPTFDPNKTMPAVPPPAEVAKAATRAAAVTTQKAEPSPEPPSRPYRASSGSRISSKSSPRIEVKQEDVEELEHPVKPVTAPIGRQKSSPSAIQGKQTAEDMLADVFMRIIDLNAKKDVVEAMQFVLALAMEKVPAEAGSVLQADLATGDLAFITATGPKAQELLRSKVVIPAGTGIAGFCSFEGVSVAVSDVQKDPRFYAAIGQKIDYETRSLLCAPMMTHGRSFGCLQLINRKDGPQFAEHEVGVLAYLAHQAALFLNNRS
ncbi:MAG: GAF domain-containing protein [Myxococcaceae bacterium]|nr:GAF domain-containing protein [Myxococcaceae bacterium]MCA3016736.1 GAF domain-containing protein [Myxococcaceae bacterium]